MARKRCVRTSTVKEDNAPHSEIHWPCRVGTKKSSRARDETGCEWKSVKSVRYIVFKKSEYSFDLEIQVHIIKYIANCRKHDKKYYPGSEFRGGDGVPKFLISLYGSVKCIYFILFYFILFHRTCKHRFWIILKSRMHCRSRERQVRER